MPYKDKGKQREANKLRQQRRRDKIKAEGVTNEGVTRGSTQALTNTSLVLLPASVPEPVRSRYARGEPEYMQAIDRLLDWTLDELKAEGVWIPVWRYTAGQDAPA